MKYRLLNLNWIYGRENTANIPRPSLTSTFDPTLVRTTGFEAQQTLPTLRQTATAADRIAGSATQTLAGLRQTATMIRNIVHTTDTTSMTTDSSTQTADTA